MYSARFAKLVVVTEHARERMKERGLDDTTLTELVETGDLKRMEGDHLFIFRHFPGRHDNLVCAAAVEEDRLVIKTIMVGWLLREQT